MEGRKARVLKAIIDTYIKTAKPIASKHLLETYDLEFSSATIRNEMAVLEQEGYLSQPHTSSGRIPSDKGYRTYVDYLMKPCNLSQETRSIICQEFSKELLDVSEFIRASAKALAFATGYTTIALSPRISHSRLKQIKLLLLEPGKALVLIVLAAGIVKDHLVNIPNIVKASDLELLARAIEEGLSGLALNEISLVTVEQCVESSNLPEELIQKIALEAYVAIKQAENLDTYIEGTQNILNHKELCRANKAKELLDIITRDGLIASYIDDEITKSNIKNQIDLPNKSTDEIAVNDGRYMLRIGNEIKLDGFSDCSFVSTCYEIGPNIFGNVGILGPKRMDYEKVVSSISFVRNILNDKKKI